MSGDKPSPPELSKRQIRREKYMEHAGGYVMADLDLYLSISLSYFQYEYLIQGISRMDAINNVPAWQVAKERFKQLMSVDVVTSVSAPNGLDTFSRALSDVPPSPVITSDSTGVYLNGNLVGSIIPGRLKFQKRTKSCFKQTKPTTIEHTNAQIGLIFQKVSEKLNCSDFLQLNIALNGCLYRRPCASEPLVNSPNNNVIKRTVKSGFKVISSDPLISVVKNAYSYELPFPKVKWNKTTRRRECCADDFFQQLNVSQPFALSTPDPRGLWRGFFKVEDKYTSPHHDRYILAGYGIGTSSKRTQAFTCVCQTPLYHLVMYESMAIKRIFKRYVGMYRDFSPAAPFISVDVSDHVWQVAKGDLLSFG